MSGPAPDCPKTLPQVLRHFARHHSPRVLFVLAPVAVAGRVHHGAFTPWDALVVAGIVAGWPFLEWLIHVFILHFRPLPVGGRVWDPKVSQKHRAHHLDPWREDLIFIPLHIYPLAVPLLIGLWLVALPLPLALTGLATTAVMALHYEWVHFLVHTRYVPRTPPYHSMWKHHRLHHMKNEQYWFGVTTRLGDKLLRTDGTTETVPTSETARTLGADAA
ncbi:MAG: sterol desaturase family protein [Deltaproteobacteria bacterium]|nr:sterol desaturase family protein [Deltaproteobacteria bacterium]